MVGKSSELRRSRCLRPLGAESGTEAGVVRAATVVNATLLVQLIHSQWR